MKAPTPFFDVLEARRAALETTLCVGIDPRPEKIPERIVKKAGPHIEDILTRFGLEVIDVTDDLAACYKPQIAFFERHGLPGLRAFSRVVRYARERELPVIGDVKRGDIGSTAAAYAEAFLVPGGDMEVGAITLNPYLGADSLVPFVETAAMHGKGLYVLLRTSNVGAQDIQEVELAAGGHVLDRVARLIGNLGRNHESDKTGLSHVGAVVGATAPKALASLRTALATTPLLVPGYGAQGASAQDVAAATRADGSGAVVNSSRGIIHPVQSEGQTWSEAVRASATHARAELYEAQVTT